MRPVFRGIPQPAMSCPMSSMKVICARVIDARSRSVNSEYHDQRTRQRRVLEQATLGVMPDVQRILDAMLAISSDLELPAVLQRIVEVACDQTGARYGAVGVLAASAEGEIRLSEFVSEGIDATPARRIGHPPRGLGILGHLIRDPRPLRLDDLGKHPDSVGFPPGHPAMRSFLGVPMRIRNEVFGNLYLTEKHGGPFTAAD